MEEMQRGALNRCQGSHSGLTTVTPWKPGTASLWPGKGGGRRRLNEDEIGTLLSTAPQVMEALLRRRLSRRS